MTLDMISGVIAAGYERKLNSKVSSKGALRKCLMLIILLAFKLISKEVYLLAYSYFTFNEILSIIENGERCGIKLPKYITDKLEEKDETNKK